MDEGWNVIYVAWVIRT